MKEVKEMVVIDKLSKSKILETIVDELDWRVALWNSLKKETEEAELLDLPRESSIKSTITLHVGTMSSLETQIATLQELYIKIKRL
jgi:hypothetical protein